MIESVIITRETIYMNSETGEIFETHDAAMEEYRMGENITVVYRYKSHETGEWSPWNYGPEWVH